MRKLLLVLSLCGLTLQPMLAYSHTRHRVRQVQQRHHKAISATHWAGKGAVAGMWGGPVGAGIGAGAGAGFGLFEDHLKHPHARKVKYVARRGHHVRYARHTRSQHVRHA